MKLEGKQNEDKGHGLKDKIVACSSFWRSNTEAKWLNGFVFIGQNRVCGELYLD